MRLGAPIFRKRDTPDSWVRAVRDSGYRAAYCPVALDADPDTAQAYAQAAAASDIVIAEVGVWKNPMAPDEAERQAALDLCKRCLELADRIGARCCVNIAGSRGRKWDGPCKDDLTEETFDMVVQTTRDIIDAVNPTRTFYTLETMPWMFPDSADSYVRLIRAMDRKAFGVHMDPANLVCSPQRYFNNADLIRECFAKLGPHIKSCHAKDIILREEFTVHLEEVRLGLGGLDYRTFLTELNALPPDTPLMLEHLPDEQEYALAAQHIREAADREGIAL